MSKYEFTESINKVLQPFLFQLKERKFTGSTVRQNRNYAGLYLQWLDKESITSVEASYNDLLSFIDHCHKQRMPSRVINRILLAIRHYYNVLDMAHNPAAGLVLKGAVRTIPHDLLSKEELETLYNQYQVADERSQRNKAILGLLVYQALTTEELHKLEAHHIRLKEGKITVPGGRHSFCARPSCSTWPGRAGSAHMPKPGQELHPAPPTRGAPAACAHAKTCARKNLPQAT